MRKGNGGSHGEKLMDEVPHIIPVEKWITRWPPKPEIAGSSPVRDIFYPHNTQQLLLSVLV